MDITLIIGSTGAALLLLAFALLTFKKIEMDSYAYQVTNLIAASLLLVYALLLSSYPFMVLNAVWTGVALYGIIRLMLRRQGNR